MHQPFLPAGDQPEAIRQLIEGIEDGLSFQTLLGVTGSGKTYTMANVIARTGPPGAGAGAEQDAGGAAVFGVRASFFRKTRSSILFPTTITTSPKPTCRRATCSSRKTRSINEHIEQMRLSATKSLLERRDVVIVCTVSAIYGIGDPVDYHSMILHLRTGEKLDQRDIIRRLTEMQYDRNEIDFSAVVPRARRRDRYLSGGTCRDAVRVSLFDDEVEKLQLFDPLTGHMRQKVAGASRCSLQPLRDAAATVSAGRSRRSR